MTPAKKKDLATSNGKTGHPKKTTVPKKRGGKAQEIKIIKPKIVNFGRQNNKTIAGMVANDHSKVTSKQKGVRYSINEESEDETTQDEETQSEDENSSGDEMEHESVDQEQPSTFGLQQNAAIDVVGSKTSQEETISDNSSEEDMDGDFEDARDSKCRRRQLNSNGNQPHEQPQNMEESAVRGSLGLFNVAERGEIYISARKYAEAITELEHSPNQDFRTKLLLAEAMLRRGSKDGIENVIIEMAEIVKTESQTVTEKYFQDLGIFMLERKKVAKALIIFACTALVLNNVRQIGMCIFRFCEAIRNIPVPKPKGKKDQPRKKKRPQSPLQKKFGVWYNSLDVLDSLMNIMLAQLRNIKPAKKVQKMKSEAFALNWMSAAYLFIGHDFLSKALECSKRGLDISLKVGGTGYKVERTRSDLYYNLGRCTAMFGNVLDGVAHIKMSIEIAEGVKDCPPKQMDDFKTNKEYKKEGLQFWDNKLKK